MSMFLTLCFLTVGFTIVKTITVECPPKVSLLENNIVNCTDNETLACCNVTDGIAINGTETDKIVFENNRTEPYVFWVRTGLSARVSGVNLIKFPLSLSLTVVCMPFHKFLNECRAVKNYTYGSPLGDTPVEELHGTKLEGVIVVDYHFKTKEPLYVFLLSAAVIVLFFVLLLVVICVLCGCHENKGTKIKDLTRRLEMELKEGTYSSTTKHDRFTNTLP